jgi:hypothetical protein
MHAINNASHHNKNLSERMVLVTEGVANHEICAHNLAPI